MLILLAVLGLGFVVSLIPFIYPHTIMNTLGAFLNHVVGEMLHDAMGDAVSSLVAGSEGIYGLTLLGVFTLYGLPILVILFYLRGR